MKRFVPVGDMCQSQINLQKTPLPDPSPALELEVHAATPTFYTGSGVPTEISVSGRQVLYPPSHSHLHQQQLFMKRGRSRRKKRRRRSRKHRNLNRVVI